VSGLKDTLAHTEAKPDAVDLFGHTNLAPVPRKQRRLRNGTMNQLAPEDNPVHNWYRFVLSFPPHLVREYIQRFRLTAAHTILDPFCGTGTTLVESKKLGIPSVGLEAHPLVKFIAEVKVDWGPNPDGLEEHSKWIARAAQADMESQGLPENQPFLGVPATHIAFRSLPAETARLLIKDSISPLPLHRTLVLLDHLRRNADERYYRHQLLALARALPTMIGNLHFGPEVGLGAVKADAPVVTSWLDGVRLIANDLRKLKATGDVPSVVHCADARQLHPRLEPNSVDAVITSPPYPNEKDYTRTTRLEAVLLGFLRSRADLRALKQQLLRSNTRNVYKGDTDDSWVAEHPEVQRLAGLIDGRRTALGKTSGFERLYGTVTKLYFGGMARHLAQLRPVLRPGAPLAYVVGDQASYLRVMIRTGRILADIAESLGYEVVGIDLFRTRLATATREQLREEVVVLRWPGGRAPQEGEP